MQIKLLWNYEMLLVMFIFQNEIKRNKYRKIRRRKQRPIIC